jgi:hypothetical protein
MPRSTSYVALALALSLAAPIAQAKVPPAQAAQLGGPKLTCTGAERAGSASGVAAFTGQFKGSWPGAKASGYDPGPYATQTPLFTVTADNLATYAKDVSPGLQALMKAQPKAYRMRVFPSQRDFAPPDWVCALAQQNAETAELTDDGLGIKSQPGALPFPFPQNGLEAVWNFLQSHRAFSDTVIHDIAAVYPNGNQVWGRNRLTTYSPGMHPDAAKRGSSRDKVATYFYYASFLPERDKGIVSVGFQPWIFATASTQAWAYQPGIRRVRQTPEVGFDYPVPPAGLHASDDDGVFNGSPARYSWKLLGKKELLVPFHNFAVNDPSLSYKTLVQVGSLNPDYLRYERRRVWVIEGSVKPGLRHTAARRIIYADEDHWMPLIGESYDSRGQLWRVNIATHFYSPEAQAFQRGVMLYHDLSLGAYEASYLVNERGKDWWRLNQPMRPEQFAPEMAAKPAR